MRVTCAIGGSGILRLGKCDQSLDCGVFLLIHGFSVLAHTPEFSQPLYIAGSPGCDSQSSHIIAQPQPLWPQDVAPSVGMDYESIDLLTKEHPAYRKVL